MKKTLLLAGILSLTALQVIAQNQPRPSFAELIAKLPQQSSGPNRVNVSRPLKSANFNWNTSGSNWDAIDSSFFTYNSQGMVTERSNGSDAATLTYREATTYDANFRLTEFLTQSYDAGLSIWVNQERHTSSYDAQGNFTADEYFSYNLGLSQWNLNYGSLYANTYNAQNQLLSRTAQEYDGAMAAYVNDYREINYLYNAFGNPSSWDEEEWDGAQWVPTIKYLYTYDGNGFPLSAEIQEWDALTSTFVPAYKYDEVVWYNWTGDLEDGLVAYTLNLSYNPATSMWDTAGQTTATYGINNSYVQLDEEFVNGAFVNSYRSTQNIDDQGRTTFEGGESWNELTSAWEVSWQMANIFTYDVDDNLTQEINQFWDQNSLALVNNTRYDYADYQTFDNTTGLLSNDVLSVAVYPNPMHESATISTAELNEKATVIQLVDLNGIVVKTINEFNGTTVEIKRDDLKAGLYFVQVKSGSSVLAITKLLID
jgi:Secretion system C-terminal sorting domain